MASFDYSAAAEADLVEIVEYTKEQWGAVQANNYIDALEARLVELARRPLVGRKRGDLAEGLFSLQFGSHVIFYTKVANGIVIARVLHARQDARLQFE